MTVLETALAIAAKLVGSVAKPIVDWVVRFFKRPKIKIGKVPSNILQFITPGTAVSRMKDLLGPPHREGAAMGGIERVIRNMPISSEYRIGDSRMQYSYEFKDVLLQLRSEDGETISEAMMLSRELRRPAKFTVYPLTHVFGKLRLGELLQAGEELKVDYSAKHHAAFVYRYFGFQGNYLHFHFGSMETSNVPKPKDDRINWVVIARSENDLPYFDWAHFI